MRSRGYITASALGFGRSRSDASLGERRWNERQVESAVGVISYDGQQCSTSCRLVEISTGGARIELDLDNWVSSVSAGHSLPRNFKLMVASLGFEADCAVVWRNQAMIGIRFAGRRRPMPRQFRKHWRQVRWTER